MSTAKAARAKPHETDVRQCAPSGYSLIAGRLTFITLCRSQYSIVVTQLPTNCYQFTDPGGMNGLVDHALPGN